MLSHLVGACFAVTSLPGAGVSLGFASPAKGDWYAAGPVTGLWVASSESVVSLTVNVSGLAAGW